MDGGRLKRCGKSNRSEAPPGGYRSDSSGKLYAFPTQRSSGSVREALRLPRPPGLRNAKIFSHLFRCPPSTHTTWSWTLSGLEFRSVISCRGWCSCWIRLYLSFTPYNRYIRSVLFGIRKQKKSLRGRHPCTGHLKSVEKILASRSRSDRGRRSASRTEPEER